MKDYNRYGSFNVNGTVRIVPFIKIPKKATDFYDDYYNTRLDLLSYKYYGDANFGWLILQANPEYGSLEYRIPEHTVLRIPYPLDATLTAYEEDIKKYNRLYNSN